jgi:steroid 5-alpha reductase family enzyme
VTEAESKRLVVLPVALALVAGLAWAGSRGGASVGGVPLFGLCVLIALAIQWIAFVPAYLARTERFFDLTGSITYVTLTLVALTLGPPVDARSGLLAALVVAWAARLGSFLFARVLAAGSDRRFDDVRTSFVRFFVVWTLQGVWVCFTMGTALAVLTSETSGPLDVFAWAGLALWVVGFGIEVVADAQKSRFRSDPQNEGRFISSGAWAWSRHPNYFGEIVLWVGVAVIAFPALEGWTLVTLVSPFFVTLLLTRVSGIPMLEERADEQWGGDADYETYKATTPVLVPRPPR